MKFSSCTRDGSVLVCGPEPTERRALITSGCATGRSSEVSNPEHKPTKLRLFSRAELETATGGFEKANLLRKGSQGSSAAIYKGTLKDGRVVAVKRQECAQDQTALKNELEILTTLRGPRFVNLIGVSRSSENATEDKFLVVDFMANGTLYDNLHQRDDVRSVDISCGSHAASMAGGAPAAAAEPMGWPLRVQIALQISKALLALHSSTPAAIHRDVNSASVLIDGKWNAKLGNFGLALRGRTDDNSKLRRSTRGEAAAAGHMDLEDDTLSSPISTKVDVFSFGILLLEILSGRDAIDVRFKPPSIVDWALPLMTQGKVHAIFDRRLLLPLQYAKALRHMVGIAARCVRKCSLRRPSMSYVVAELQEVSKKIPMAKWADGLATVVKLANPSCKSPDLDVFRERSAWAEGITPASLTISVPCDSKYPSQIPRLTGTGLDKPLHSGKALPLPQPRRAADREDYYRNVGVGRLNGRFVSTERMVSAGRLGERMTRATEDRITSVFGGGRYGDVAGSAGAMAAAEELPQATMEVRSLGGRRRVYCQWRNPMFNERLGQSELEKAIVLPLNVGRPGPGSADHGVGRRFYPVVPISGLDCHTERTLLMSAARPTTRGSGAAIYDSSVPPSQIPVAFSHKVRSRNVRSSSRKAFTKAQESFQREEAMLPW